MSDKRGANESDAGSAHASTPSLRVLANPVPVGLFSFAGTGLLLSLYNVRTRDIHTPNAAVGLALFAGGLLQFIAGMWEFPRGSTFGATVLSSYGAFWLSYATILIPSSGILAAYGDDQQELGNALGLYFIIWFIFTTLLIPAVVTKHLAFTFMLSTLSITFIVLAAGEFLGKSSLIKGGGIIGIITSFAAYYIAFSELLAADGKPIVKVPQGVW